MKKKLFLTLVGVASSLSLGYGSYDGTTWTGDTDLYWADQWSGQQVPLQTALPILELEGGTYQPPSNWNMDDGDPARANLYSSADGNQYGLYFSQNYPGYPGSRVLLEVYPNTPNQRYSITYVGDDFGNLSLVSVKKHVWGAGVTASETDIETELPPTLNLSDWLVNPEDSYDWLAIGGFILPPSPSGGAFVEQAQELNEGLTFQDGQWAPAQ